MARKIFLLAHHMDEDQLTRIRFRRAGQPVGKHVARLPVVDKELIGRHLLLLGLRRLQLDFQPAEIFHLQQILPIGAPALHRHLAAAVACPQRVDFHLLGRPAVIPHDIGQGHPKLPAELGVFLIARHALQLFYRLLTGFSLAKQFHKSIPDNSRLFRTPQGRLQLFHAASHSS